jgi:hypothetical protein
MIASVAMSQLKKLKLKKNATAVPWQLQQYLYYCQKC